MNIDIKVINPKNVPLAVGAYSQAIVLNELVFVSGQIAINPDTNQFVNGSIEDQLKQILSNINNILTESNSQFENVLKVTIYTTDLSYFPLINEIYGKRFKNHFPARSCVEVSKLPLNAKIEIEVISKVNN